MKRVLVLLCLLASCLLFAAAKAGKAASPDAPADLLLFCGGRPWPATQVRDILSASGITVRMIDSAQLAGFGGVSLRKFAGDEEQKAKDGITPEFSRLARYKAVMFTAIPQDLLTQMLTPERVALLEKYVQNGGGLLLDCQTPDSLNRLLPVEFNGKSVRPQDVLSERPALPGSDILPETWAKLTSYRPATAKQEAQTHAVLRDAAGKVVAPGVVSCSIGKGKVVFFNGTLSYNANALVHFCHWAYCRPFMAVLLNQFSGMKVDLQKALNRPPRLPKPEALGTLAYTFREENTSFKVGGKIELKKSTAHFANGITLKIGTTGDVRITYPGAALPVHMNRPQIKSIGKIKDFAAGEHEAIERSASLKTVKVDWTLQNTQAKPDCLELSFRGKTDDGQDAAMRWQLIPVEVTLDGRRYIGVGDRIIMDRFPRPLESIEFSAKVPSGKLRRLTCYTKPRGYMETVLSREPGKISDTKAWQFFCSGQPFTYIAGTDGGIFADFPDEALPCYGQFTARKDGDQMLNRKLRWRTGPRLAPVRLPIFWHLYSPGGENGNNDYLAIYQYVRRHLRRKYGIRSYPQITLSSCYLHGQSPESLAQSMQTAAELNFKGIWLSYCPLPMEQIGGDMLGNTMKIARKYGLQPHAWTPGGYGHGDKQEVFVRHPEWFIRNPDGAFKKYFNLHSVGDFNSPEFRAWYLEQIDKARDNGMARVYMDMGGEISVNVNYAVKDATPNITGFIELLKEYGKRDLPASVEGMNPLVRDQALMRPDKSYPMVGKEFAYVDSSPLASVDHGKFAGLYFDYFRLGMFHAVINIDVDGYRLKFERVPGELERVREIGELNRLFNKANEFVPLPFVRETPFGAAWITSNTGALFFERGVKKLDLKLPPGWQIKGNAALTDIPARSVILLQKNK